MKRWFAVLLVLVLLPFVDVSAQLPAPNDAGVAWGLVRMTVRDLDANKRFFTTLGGTLIKIDEADVVKFPGLLIFLAQGNPVATNQGTSMNHFGFTVPSIVESVPKWRAAGIKANDPGNNGEFTFIFTPDDQRIEVNPSQSPYLAQFPLGLSRELPISSYHLHFWHREDSVAREMEAWYVSLFGATRVSPLRPGGVGNWSVPGTMFSFSSAANFPAFGPDPGPTLPTKGRVVDRIGFEVKNLEAFCKKLEAMGVKFVQPFSTSRHPSFAGAEFTDPWGTSVELTEGLSRF